MVDTPRSDDEMILLGKVSGVFGVKGWVKIHSDTEPRENILTYSPWYLQRQGRWQAYRLLAGKRQGKTVIAQLEDVSDRDVAAELRDTRIAIRRSQLPSAEEGHYYWSDLVGLQVVTTDGVELGEIDALMETGANDVLVVHEKTRTGQKPVERLIPFIQDGVIKSIDLSKGQMVVDWDADF